MIGLLVVTAVALIGQGSRAQAYAPTGGVMYQLGNSACLKGTGNCAIYPKAASLPDGRLVASFEQSTVPSSGSAIGQTLPIYKSDDYGTTWQKLTDLKAPAYLSNDPQYAKYTSAWTNPYLYVLPQNIGNLKAGTLMLAAVVSGQDDYYVEQKAANPNWVPTNDGDRQDLAIALYSSTDDGNTWTFNNIIAQGGWQGGSAGNIGGAISTANTYSQVDPVWEPYLLAYNGQLIAYYSDENDYIGFDRTTGIATIDPNNATATDSHGQILAHRTWDGTSNAWSAPVVDVAGSTIDMGNGKTEIGGDRPGMENVVPTTDGKWLATYEYFGGGADHFKIANSPLDFRDSPDSAGADVSTLPVDQGSGQLAEGGCPVVISLPNGSLVYNAGGSGDVWVNASGSSTGIWREYKTTVGAGYSRNLTYENGTGRIAILQGVWGGPTAGATIRYGEVDLGNSAGTYYQIVNKLTGQVIGTGGRTNDDAFNSAGPSVQLEIAGSSTNPDTEYWHLSNHTGGSGVTLLNKSGGRSASVWGGTADAGTAVGLWTDDTTGDVFNLLENADGTYAFQSSTNPSVYLTGSSTNAHLSLQNATTDGSQAWTLVPLAPSISDLTTTTQSSTLIASTPTDSNRTVSLNAAASNPAGTALHVNTTGRAYVVTSDGTVSSLGPVSFNAQQQSTVTLPNTIASGATVKIVVEFDTTQLMWGSTTIASTTQTLTNRNSGLLLDVYQASTADGATVTQWAANGGLNQKWHIQPLTGGYSQVVSANSGKCLDVYPASTADGGPVVQKACNGSTDQQWLVSDPGNGYVTLINRNSTKCLDVNAFSTSNGAKVQQWTCNGGTNQQWARASA